jgi:hypothetical protein
VRSLIPAAQSLEGWGAYISTANQFTFNKEKTWIGDINVWYQFPEVKGASPSAIASVTIS